MRLNRAKRTILRSYIHSTKNMPSWVTKKTDRKVTTNRRSHSWRSKKIKL